MVAEIWVSVISSFVDQLVALKEYSSLQENPYHVRYIHTVLIIHIYFAPWQWIMFKTVYQVTAVHMHLATHISMSSQVQQLD